MNPRLWLRSEGESARCWIINADFCWIQLFFSMLQVHEKRPFDTSFGLLRDRIIYRLRDRFNWNKLIFVRSLSLSKGAQHTTRYSTPPGSLNYHIPWTRICDSDGIGLLSFLLATRTLSSPKDISKGAEVVATKASITFGNVKFKKIFNYAALPLHDLTCV